MRVRVLLLSLLGALATTAAWCADEPAKKRAVDLYGDPLPPGAVARLGTVRFRRGSDYQFAGLAFLADNKTVLTAQGNNLQFWDVPSGKLVRELKCPMEVGALAISPDSKKIAVAVGQLGLAEIQILDVASGNPLHALKRDDPRDIFGGKLAFSPDGALLFSLAHAGKLRVEEIASGKQLAQTDFSKDYVGDMALSSDGTQAAVATGPNSQMLLLWKWREQEPLPLQQDLRVRSVRFSPDGKLLAALCEHPDRLRVWNVAERRLLYQQACPETGVSFSGHLAFTPDNQTLLVPFGRRNGTGSDGGGTLLLDPASGTKKGILKGEAHMPAVSPDSKLLASTSGHGLRVWDLPSQKEITEEKGHNTWVSGICITPRDEAVTRSDDGTVRVWDAATGKERHVWRFYEWVRDIALSPDGRLLATSCMDDTVRLLDVGNGKEIYKLPGHGRLGGKRTVAFAPDGSRFFSWGDDFYLRGWDVKTGRALFEHAIRPSGVKIPDPEDPFVEREFLKLTRGPGLVAPDGKRFVLDIAGVFHFFDVATGQERRTTASNSREPGFGHGPVISPNGKYLLSSSYGRREDNTHEAVMRLWNGEGFHELTLPGYSSGPVAFSADSRSFAVTAEPAELRIFETASGRERHRITGLPSRAHSLAFFPDSRRLASGHSDGTVLIWDLTASSRE
jgi:WD40 repeat protein